MARNEEDVLARVQDFAEKRHGERISGVVSALLPFIGKDRDVILEYSSPSGRDEAVAGTVCARVEPTRTGPQWLVVTASVDRVAAIAKQFERWINNRSGIRVARLGEADSATAEARRASGTPQVIVATADRLIDHIRRDNLQLDSVSGWVIDAAKPSTGFTVDLAFIATKLNGDQSTVVVSDVPTAAADGLQALMSRPTIVRQQQWRRLESEPASEPVNEQLKERLMKHKELPFDEEQMAQRLKEIVKEIHEEEDPVELTQYRKFIKKHVGLFSRSYLAAYLVKNASGAPRSGRERQSSSKSEGRRRRRDRADRADRSSSSEEREYNEAGTHTSIFVSVGRNRRVKAADLSTLFTSADGIAENDLGQVKVLDNFSFVEVTNEKAGTAIERLNGTEFRGRKLTVNYARKK